MNDPQNEKLVLSGLKEENILSYTLATKSQQKIVS